MKYTLDKFIVGWKFKVEKQCYVFKTLLIGRFKLDQFTS